jgi:hypothetical protein
VVRKLALNSQTKRENRGLWTETSLGAEPDPVDTAAFRKLLNDEGKLLSTLIKDRKITPE